MRWTVVPAIALAMFVVVPLGLRLLAAPGLAALRRAWPVAAGFGFGSLLLPVGTIAAGLASVYAAATVALAGTAATRFWKLRSLAPVELAVFTALVTPSVAGSALVAERGGWALLGFAPKILLLTVAHFHYAGFAAALVASLVCRLSAKSRLASLAALAVPVGTLIVLLGFFLGDVVGLLGAAVLTAGMWLVAGLSWRARSEASDRVTRALLGVSSAVLLLTMVLALDWALGKAFGVPRLNLAWMAATHGVLNAVGFGLCAVLAWGRMLPGGVPPGVPVRDRPDGPSGRVRGRADGPDGRVRGRPDGPGGPVRRASFSGGGSGGRTRRAAA